MAAAVRVHHHLSFLLLFTSLLSFSSATETESLLRLKQSLTKSDRSLSSWIPNVSPCSGTWLGVICFDNTITGLHLSDLGLSGPIDVDALAEIRGLRTLSFINNSFSDTIPSFNKLGSIKSLLLAQNRFSGTIPTDFFSPLNSLKKLWLASNNFSGEIPQSLTQLELLKELHLESNSFSGQIPNFNQDLKSLDFSNNKLQGAIPESLARFNPNSFAGNQGLCGKPLEKPCDDDASSSSSSEKTNGPSWAMKVIVVLVIAVVVVVVAMIFLFVAKNQRRGEGEFRAVSRSSSGEVLTVQVPSPRAGAGESKKVESNKRGEIVMVNEERGVFGIQDLMKASAEVIGNGGLGSTYKAAMGMGMCVVVKRMREMNKIGKDVFDAEMRQFGRILFGLNPKPSPAQ